MPLVIGGKPESNFANPLGLLTDCHRRIEYFLDQLIAVTDTVQGGALAPEAREALEKAVRYFREAAPRHTRDEEDSLFPRMRLVENEEAQKALDALESLESDHARADEWHAEVDRLAEWWLVEGTLPADEVQRLAEVLQQLRELYRHHIEVEDTYVFPTAGHVLDADTVRQVGREMAARRGIDPDAPAAPPPPLRASLGRKLGTPVGR